MGKGNGKMTSGKGRRGRWIDQMYRYQGTGGTGLEAIDRQEQNVTGKVQRKS